MGFSVQRAHLLELLLRELGGLEPRSVVELAARFHDEINRKLSRVEVAGLLEHPSLVVYRELRLVQQDAHRLHVAIEQRRACVARRDGFFTEGSPCSGGASFLLQIHGRIGAVKLGRGVPRKPIQHSGCDSSKLACRRVRWTR